MVRGSILFVHGTGVRLKSYQKTFAAVRTRALEEGIGLDVVECEWGSALGIEAPSLSLPGWADSRTHRVPAERSLEWAHLEVDPFFELRLLIETGTVAMPPFGRPAAHELLWRRIAEYRPSLELEALLARGQAQGEWPTTWDRIVIESPLAKQAIAASGDDTADAAFCLARALFAQLNVQVQASGSPALGEAFRERFVERLRVDWGQQVFALKARLKSLLGGALRERRHAWGEPLWPILGDVLLYQANGSAIRDFIRRKIASLTPPVYVLAHSLGGVASVDLLALPDPPAVAGLITVGSQSPLLYELGALFSIKRNEKLPDSFPRWINLYDCDDFLSYVAERLFPERVKDIEVRSGELPPGAHSAYWNCPETWTAIKAFVGHD